jgi:hypothetical protein
MLLSNYSYINRVLGRNHSGPTNPLWINKPEVMRNFYAPDDINNILQIKKDSFSTGSAPPYSYVLGPKGALLSSTTQSNGASTLSGGISQGINILSDLEGSGSVVSNLSLITSMNATIAGIGDLTASLVGTIALSATVGGTGTISAGLSLVSSLIAALDGEGLLTANLKGTLAMEADIYVNQSEATVQQLVEGVWNAIAADFNNPGTTGQALGAAGSAGDPWITTLPGAYTGDQAGAIVDRLETLVAQIKTLTLVNLK